MHHGRLVFYHVLVVLIARLSLCFSLFFFNDTATTEIYTLSLHDALPILAGHFLGLAAARNLVRDWQPHGRRVAALVAARSEEHTSELQSRLHLVCRLLLEKKKKIIEQKLS